MRKGMVMPFPIKAAVMSHPKRQEVAGGCPAGRSPYRCVVRLAAFAVKANVIFVYEIGNYYQYVYTVLCDSFTKSSEIMEIINENDRFDVFF